MAEMYQIIFLNSRKKRYSFRLIYAGADMICLRPQAFNIFIDNKQHWKTKALKVMGRCRRFSESTALLQTSK